MSTLLFASTGILNQRACPASRRWPGSVSAEASASAFGQFVLLRSATTQFEIPDGEPPSGVAVAVTRVPTGTFVSPSLANAATPFSFVVKSFPTPSGDFGAAGSHSGTE